MPKDVSLKKVLVIGSGPIVIGQAAEFDYAGTQACHALREEGVEVVLINSNPATIMTDPHVADQVYIEPLTVEFVTQVIRKERPDGLLPTLGGQTGLNLAVELAQQGILAREKVRLLGTDLKAIQQAEDREQFRRLMREINEPTPESVIAHTLEEALRFAEKIGYPLIVRPAYTLGGTGGGIANNEGELREIVENGLRYSPIGQCLIEQSIAGWKEIELEVVRDGAGQAIVVCAMENLDPVGVHTGDSIVFAPCQTLKEHQSQMLRDSALRIVQALNLRGGCNVQYALDPTSNKYYVIEVNPRVSRSSALASKATGYPIAKVAAKVALGFRLDELIHPESGEAYASVEPQMNHIVCKIPRWPFDKFTLANRRLGTQMKATGEVMAIGSTVEESLLKAVRSLELDVNGFLHPTASSLSEQELKKRLQHPDDERLFLLAEGFRRGMTIEELHDLTRIDSYFLAKIAGIVAMEQSLASSKGWNREQLLTAKKMGFTDRTIADLVGEKEVTIRKERLKAGIFPVFKKVDTRVLNRNVETPCFYSTYEGQGEQVLAREKPCVVVLGSGPIQIGQGVEFDYATVHAIKAIQEMGLEAVIINNNPETVSTDYQFSDRLYFEPLHIEDVLHIIERENPLGVIVQFGGQTSLNLARSLAEHGVTILGTSLEEIDRAENREKFEQLLEELKIERPPGVTATSVSEAMNKAAALGFPVLVRPSYVLGGRAMEIVHNQQELLSYIEAAVEINPEQPVLIDRYLTGKELEVDAISDGKQVLIAGIMEHIERSGVHSGDSIAIYPAQSISAAQKERIVEITTKIALALKTKGLINIQFVLTEDEPVVIEVNPRASRTLPFLSKVTRLPMAQVGTRIMMGQTLEELGYSGGLWEESDQVAVKVPVFSFAKLRRVDIMLGPEMKSTGEVMGRDQEVRRAIYKGLLAAGVCLPRFGTVIVTLGDKEKPEAVALCQRFYQLGYRIVATRGTAAVLRDAGLPVTEVNKLSEGSPHILDMIRKGEADLVVNTWTQGRTPARDGFRIRREAVEHGVACFTTLDTVEALLSTLESTYLIAEPIDVPVYGKKNVI